MSIKIVVFGEAEQVTKFGIKSRGAASDNGDDIVAVETLAIQESNFLLFSVKDRSLVSAQASGANGLLFFLGSETPLFEQKQFLLDLLESKPDFDGVPVAVIFQRGQQLSLKEVVNYLQLYRLKERASMIKEISWEETDWLDEVYGWVKVQSEENRGRGFQAAPKVVKMKAKFRETYEEESEKKYEHMLNEKEVRVMGVKQQEDIYIDREKEKLKQENMEKQLSNFSKNKKKMAPYDIKPTPNPKIEPNLHFFLKDPHSQPPPEVSIKIQTDEFKERPPPPPYKPKKTGINTSTQIEENELFNFDKEVKPIVTILTTKALETAALQIEEEQQLDKMVKYKWAYQQRLKKQKEHEQKNIDQEKRIIKEKEKLLQEHRKKAEINKTIQKRTQCYQLASSFLQGIYYQSADKLITANAYPDSLANYLRTDYLNNLISKAAQHYQKIQQEQIQIKGIFEQDVVSSLKSVATGPKELRQKMKKKKEARLINSSPAVRKVRLLYKHPHLQFSNFAKHISKHFDNTLDEHVKVLEEQIQEVSDRVQSGEATEDELLKIKLKDSLAFSESGHQNFLLRNNSEICFTSTPNRYEKSTSNSLSNGLLLLDKDGELIEELTFGKVNPKLDYLRIESGLREIRESINMDEGMTVNLQKIPEKVKNIVFLVKVAEVQKLKAENELKQFRFATYGVEFWQHKIPIHSKNIGETVKWEQVAKGPEGEEPLPAQDAIVVAYILRRRMVPDYWTLEDVSYVSQPYKTQEELNHFLGELSKFYYKSNEYLKEEEEEQRVETSPTEKKSSKQDSRSRSRKLIEEPKKKIVIKVATKVLEEVEVKLSQPFQEVYKKLANTVEEWKQFTQSCQNGWQLMVRGRKLESVDQLAAFRKVGDVLVKRVPKVQEPKIEKIEEQEGEKGEGEE